MGGPTRNTWWLRTALDRLAERGVKAGIYTGAWWWNDPRHMNSSTAFRETPLWYAEYDGVPDLFHWTPFGGWLNPAGKQYDTTGALCGISPIDRNVFADWVLTPPEPPAPEPTLEQVQLGLIRKVLDEDWPALKRDALKLAP